MSAGEEGNKLFWTLLGVVAGAAILSGGSAFVTLHVLVPEVEELREWRKTHTQAHNRLVRRTDWIQGHTYETYMKIFKRYPVEMPIDVDDQ